MGCVPNLVFAASGAPGEPGVSMLSVFGVSGDATIASFEIASFMASFLGRPRFLGGGAVLVGVSDEGIELEGW